MPGTSISFLPLQICCKGAFIFQKPITRFRMTVFVRPVSAVRSLNPETMIRIRTVTLFAVFLFLIACRQEESLRPDYTAPFLQYSTERTDSLLTAMSLEEKIGQLIFVELDEPAEARLEEAAADAARRQISGFDLRGLPLERYLDWRKKLIEQSGHPLFWGSREERLLNGHFSDVENQPGYQTLTALRDDSLRSRIEALHYRQLAALQMNWVATPDAENGQTPRELEMLTNLRMLGVAHWPDYEPLLRQESINTSLSAAHQAQVAGGLSVVRLPWRPVLQDSLSQRPDFLAWKLQRQTGFDGLLAGELRPGVDPVAFLRAGADQLIAGSNWRSVFEHLRQAAINGEITKEALDRKARRVLQAKQWMAKADTHEKEIMVEEQPVVVKASFGPTRNPGKNLPVSVSRILREHFNDPDWVVLKHSLYHQSITLLSNPNDRLPFDLYRTNNFRLIQYADQSFYDFRKQFEKYADYRSHLVKPAEDGRLRPLDERFLDDRINIVLLDQAVRPERDQAFVTSIRETAKRTPVVLINFGSDRSLQPFDSTLTVMQIYERNEITERMAAQVLFGALAARGQLPHTVNKFFRANQGVQTQATRLAYSIPQEVGIDPVKLVGIDAIMNSAVDDRVIPGGQVLVAKEGKVIYSKAFGYHTFRQQRKVDEHHLYDVASITKVAATTLAAMQLYELGKYELNDRLAEHLDLLPDATIKNIPIKKILIHQSGLQSNMPIAPYVFAKGGPNLDCQEYFCRDQSDTFSIQVAEHVYFNRYHQDTLWQRIQRLRLRSQYRYRYSDVNFMLVQKLIEQKTQTPLDKWVYAQFYKPLGLRHSLFNPLQKFAADRIVPTQHDRRWRQQLLTGYVHDESAALMGGVGGSAGLFTTAEDLAVVFQMLLNKGIYGGRRYVDAKTVELFTSARHGNHRGLGFDKPSSRTRYPSYAEEASGSTFGHTGFTGTCVWADPEQDLIYIFLANRVYPNGSNRAFFKSNIRQRIHEVIYDALDTFDPELPHLPDTRELIAREG